MRVCVHNGQNSGGQAQELIGALGSVRVLVHLCSYQQPEVPFLSFPVRARHEKGAQPLPPCRGAVHTGGSAARLLRVPVHQKKDKKGKNVSRDASGRVPGHSGRRVPRDA